VAYDHFKHAHSTLRPETEPVPVERQR
jgi:hypothetical protein